MRAGDKKLKGQDAFSRHLPLKWVACAGGRGFSILVQKGEFA